MANDRDRNMNDRDGQDEDFREGSMSPGDQGQHGGSESESGGERVRGTSEENMRGTADDDQDEFEDTDEFEDEEEASENDGTV